MFRLHKNRAPKSRERLDFKFSQVKALQVPKGWDKLFVSIISVETGKTMAKSGKGFVRNGSCQWTETFTESVWVSKEIEDCNFKLVVTMGSARSGILGEATINMTSYMSSNAAVPISLPLKKCNHGTILQVKIHCLTARAKTRDEESKGGLSHSEDPDANSGNGDIKSDGTASIFARTTGSSSSKDLDSTSHQGEQLSRESSFYSGSNHSSGSADGLVVRENLSSRNDLSDDEQKLIRRHDLASSQNSGTQGSDQDDEHSQSNNSSFNSQITYSENHSQDNEQELATSSLRITDSSKILLEAAEDTIEELREEAKMWERNARKLMLDLDILRKELSDHSKNQANLDIELSAANAERDGLKKEVEQLKELVESSMEKQSALEDLTVNSEVTTHIQKELKSEIKFQKESNANLALHLKKSQEANIELFSVLQELEETTEKQRIEILDLQSNFSNMENPVEENVEAEKNLMLQLQRSQQSEKNLQSQVHLLEQAMEKNNDEINNLSLNKQTFFEVEREYKDKLSAKEEEIVSLKAKLSEFIKDDEERCPEEMESNDAGNATLIREIESLKEKLRELERDCNELTDENLELLFKLKEITNDSLGRGASVEFSSSELLAESSGSEVSEHKSKMHYLEEQLKKKVLEEIRIDCDLSSRKLETSKMELEFNVTELGEELTSKRTQVERLEGQLLSKEEKIGDLRRSQSELEAKVSELLKEKVLLEEIVQRESDITTKCLNDLRSDLTVLSSSLDSNVSANKILERKSSDLENDKRELEHHLSELECENEQLSVCISGLETQLRDLTDERDSLQLELENSKSFAIGLQDEITRLRTEMETQKTDMKTQLHDMYYQFSETQEECEYLRRENLKLQDTAESLIQECNSLQKLNGEMRKEKLKLHEYCTHLEAQLRESDKNVADGAKRIETLEENLSSVLQDFALKEKSLTSELDSLLDENRRHKEKIMQGESLLNQIYLEKETDVENLQREVENLTRQLSAGHDERERIASEALHEVTGLNADKCKLEAALQEVQSKLKWTEDELSTVRNESKEAETNVQGLMGELSALKKNQEMLVADHEKMLKLLENYKSREEKFKNDVNGLELKLTVSEYERQQLIEESTSLKVQLLKIDCLQDEVLASKNDINAAKSEKEKLEGSLHLLSSEREYLKAEKILLVEKISTLQKAASELEDYKRNRVALEEKLQKLEALCAQDDELKSELGEIKIINRKMQRKIQLLEEEKKESLRRSQALEEELKYMKEGKQNQRDSNGKSSYKNEHQRERNNKYEIHDGSPDGAGVDTSSKIQLLENELAKAVEENNTYKVQLNRFLSESRNNQKIVPRESTAKGEVVAKERYERTKSLLEADLKDIRERYFHMSLKYAEVEAQREELVMKIKEARNANRWFS